MKLLLVTDAWEPQVNGVVRTLGKVTDAMRAAGHEVEVVHPGLFRTVPCPTYPEIRLALLPGRGIRRVADRFEPDALHIATEGPLGLAARRLCRKRHWPFTTSFHTRFPEYVQARCGLPAGVTYRAVRWFHGAAERMMVATPSVRAELEERGFTNCADWTRGVDTELFRPREESVLDLPRPIHACVGRVAVEKNLEAFLALDLPGSKLIVGDGPQRAELERKYPEACFTGAKFGEELARHFASADVFVFPSRTDTFGLVLLEAMASGLPVAAYPVPGPRDVLARMSPEAPVGCLDEDLGRACRVAAGLAPEACRAYALGFSWRACAEIFQGHLAPIDASVESFALAGAAVEPRGGLG